MAEANLAFRALNAAASERFPASVARSRQVHPSIHEMDYAIKRIKELVQEGILQPGERSVNVKNRRLFHKSYKENPTEWAFSQFSI